jgi:hypothetical protein
MTEGMTAWQCIGCGRLEGPQNCIGICEDRKVQLVYASQLDAALADAARARQPSAALLALVRQLALTTPRAGEWEHSYRVLQDRARQVLATLADNRAISDTGVGGNPTAAVRSESV